MSAWLYIKGPLCPAHQGQDESRKVTAMTEIVEVAYEQVNNRFSSPLRNPEQSAKAKAGLIGF